MATEGEKRRLLKHHPIQLTSLEIVELYIKINSPVDEIDGSDAVVSMKHAFTEYDGENKMVDVRMKIEIGMDEDSDLPFSLRVEVVGTFSVDEDRFKKEHVPDWAERNAPFILYPYLREQAFALTTRCGLPAIILPLLEVPTFEVKQPRKRQPRKSQEE